MAVAGLPVALVGSLESKSGTTEGSRTGLWALLRDFGDFLLFSVPPPLSSLPPFFLFSHTQTTITCFLPQKFAFCFSCSVDFVISALVTWRFGSMGRQSKRQRMMGGFQKQARHAKKEKKCRASSIHSLP
jgi:hypothetical protein